jgi:hypothetical protein
MIEDFNLSKTQVRLLIKQNKNILISVLKDAGYDAEFLMQWGIPDFWQEINWIYTEHVVALLQFFIKKFSLNIPTSCLDSLYENLGIENID